MSRIASDPVEEIILGTSNLKESVDYWNRILDMKVLQLEPKVATLAYDENQTKLALRDVGKYFHLIILNLYLINFIRNILKV